MKHATCLLLSVGALFATTASSRDITTTAGVTYTNAVLKRVEPDGITISHVGGLVKLHPSQLPQELREKFHFNAQQAAIYAQRQAAEVRAAAARRDAVLAQRQLDEARREAAEKKKKEYDEKTRVWYLQCRSSDSDGIFAYDRFDNYYWIPGWKVMPDTWFTIEAVNLGLVQISASRSAYKLIPHPIPASRKK